MGTTIAIVVIFGGFGIIGGVVAVVLGMNRPLWRGHHRDDDHDG